MVTISDREVIIYDLYGMIETIQTACTNVDLIHRLLTSLLCVFPYLLYHFVYTRTFVKDR